MPVSARIAKAKRGRKVRRSTATRKGLSGLKGFPSPGLENDIIGLLPRFYKVRRLEYSNSESRRPE